MTRHERFREGLARFEFSGRPGWTEQQPVLRREAVGHACAQRDFRPYDGEIDVFRLSNSGESVRAGHIRGNGPRQLRDTWIARRGNNFGRIGIAEQPGNERVFPGSATDHENSHFCNGLAVEPEG